MVVIVWFHDIGVHVKLALFLFQFSRNWHTPCSTLRFGTRHFWSVLVWHVWLAFWNGSVFWFHGIGIHVNLVLLLSALRWAHRIGLRIKSEKMPTIRGGWSMFIFSRSCLVAAGLSVGSVFWFHGIGVHVKLTLLLSALRWARNRVAHQVWKICHCRCRLKYSHFFEELSFGCWHLDWFSILIWLNWRARQAHSFTFGITLSTEQGCPSRLNKIRKNPRKWLQK